MATTVKQPAWQAPEQPPDGSDLPPISIYNSLTRSKTPFVPIDWKNRSIQWYACGPTVYDDAHLGHGRNYVSTDIIRRILVYYFKFKVHFCMNITDVDDKIIIRGRQRHLLYEYNRKGLDNTEDASRIWRQALSAYISKNLPNVPTNTEPEVIREVMKDTYGDLLKGPVLGDKEAKTLMHVRTVTSASNVISPPEAEIEASKADLESLDDILMPYFDSRFGSSVDSSDLSIWTRLTREYEDRFTEDMRSLNVLDPDEVTRVTEFGESIVSYIKTIQEHKFAYAVGESGSQSVYFDINAFEAANNSYARLEPWNRNDKSLQADGEGALTEQPSGKRGAADFALWKASKAGEPSWPSPWGPGRPGWHIECSAMASDRLGSHIDIHSGGIDLAFPHHDNELAQSEAYWSDGSQKHQHQWINYFLHMGHLSIQGSKMSKSLKNFTTIRTALARGDFTPRSLRIIFLLGVWRDGIEITDSLVKEGSAFEDKLNNFFLKAKDIAEDKARQNGVHKPETKLDEDLLKAMKKAEKNTYDALCDNFHTPTVLAVISELISEYNRPDPDKLQPLPATTMAIARWVTSMVNIFGLNGTAGPDDQSIGWSGIDVPEAAIPVLTALSFKRDLLREKAAAGTLDKDDLNPVPSPRISTPFQQLQNADTFKDVLSAFNRRLSSLHESTNLVKDVRALADELRDVHLFDRGVYLEDREHRSALIRPVTKELKQAKQEKDNKALEKQRAKEQREKEAAAKAEKGRLSHKDMFKTEDYSAWDAEGVPTHEKDGEEVTKSKRKKLQKDWERQKKLHEAYLKTIST